MLKFNVCLNQGNEALGKPAGLGTGDLPQPTKSKKI